MNNSGNEVEVSPELKLNKTSRAKYEGTMRSFNGQAIIQCLVRRWKGLKATEQLLCPMPELMISSERWLMNYLRVHARGITLETWGCTGESGFDPGTCGLWAHHVVLLLLLIFFNRSSDILHGHDSKACQRVPCQLCRQQRWYQGRGTKRTIFLLVATRRTNRQSSHPSVVTGMSSTKVTGSYWQNCTMRCLPKQENITA